MLQCPGLANPRGGEAFFGVARFTFRAAEPSWPGFRITTRGQWCFSIAGRLIWTALPEHGLHAQVRWRGFDASDHDVGGLYFNPAHYSRWDPGLYVRRWLGGWRLYGTGVISRESIAAVDARLSAALEFRAEGPLSEAVQMDGSALYTRSAGFAVADAYGYLRASVMLIISAW